ncbi:hypothetical protein [Texcoconibacillus texcoconensis]|uniref:Uncharacterized protein n=1 Tax=Texcoconibacillus texcoconensis TaxID=1095777 RepID=A0A840QMB3_9BACI|nr:hypothetical protein [Texcoconibacillus texcoconensis]MBB5172470.1 hypothetical protein [Texcoconibacillus texcoconensis]
MNETMIHDAQWFKEVLPLSFDQFVIQSTAGYLTMIPFLLVMTVIPIYVATIAFKLILFNSTVNNLTMKDEPMTDDDADKFYKCIKRSFPKSPEILDNLRSIYEDMNTSEHVSLDYKEEIYEKLVKKGIQDIEKPQIDRKIGER